MSDIQLRDQIITFLIAGHETTANALTWTFYLLTQNSHVEEKLFQEIKTVLKDKKYLLSEIFLNSNTQKRYLENL